MHRILLVAIAVLSAATSAHAAFDLDPRIRPRLDGRYVLPAPFDRQDAAIEVGTLGECEEGYLFCDPSFSCETEDACCPSDVQVGQSLMIPNPFRLELPGATAGQFPVRMNLMSGGSCYGQDMQEAIFYFLDFDSLGAPDDDCLSCLVAMWMYMASLIPECPADCSPDSLFGTFLCLFLSEGPELLARPAGGPGTPGFLATLGTLRDQVMATSAAGQRYTQLYVDQSPALIRVVPSRPWLVWMIGDALPPWLTALNALLAGQGAGVTITQQMMDDWLAIVAEFQAGAPPATAAVIQAELDRLELPSFVGLNMDEARARFEERGVEGPAGCGDGFDGADCALAELLAADVCGTETPHAKLGALLQQRVGKARDTLARAAASTKAAKTRKLVRKTAKQLGALQRKVRKSKSTPDACKTTLDGMMEQRRRLVAALAS
jgi:hypothetical protein